MAPFVQDLAAYLRTDTLGPGTLIADMKVGVDQYLIDHNLDQAFTVTLVHQPEWPWVVEEVVRSEDVVLLLGFWEWNDGVWTRLGGHYVTVAGVDPVGDLIGLSDPFFDQAEQGWPWLGRVLNGALVTHAPIPGHAPQIHNDAGNISHDVYHVAASPSPGGTWGPADYPGVQALDNFIGQNGEPGDPLPGGPDSSCTGMPTFLTIVITSSGGSSGLIGACVRQERWDVTIRDTDTLNLGSSEASVLSSSR